jgi:4a-hydroxytetrahydrobiopterin dehydratase
MNVRTTDQLISRKCTACHGGVPKWTSEQAQAQLRVLDGWRLTHDGLRIRKDWQLTNFLAGIDLLVKVAQLAEQEGHHPDLHLEGYRHVWIETWTHAIGGLSESDFILAAKIDQVPVKLTKEEAAAGS